MNKSTIRLVLTIVVAGIASSAGYLFSREQQAPQPASATGSAPQNAVSALMNLRLATPDGQWQKLSDWRGTVLVVNYWATWCPPCREEMPAFSRLHDKYKASGVQFVGIAIDSVDKVREFNAKERISYPLLIGTMDTMLGSAALGNAAQALPFTAIIDRTGKLDSVKLGRFPETELDARLRVLSKQ